MDRRDFLRAGTVATGATALGFTLTDGASARLATPGPSPYGALQPADGNGLMLPRGFVSRVLARTGQRVGTSSYVWHPAPDGGDVFPDGVGGWIYVSNSEITPNGGAGAIRFRPNGGLLTAYRVLSGTRVNCAGGATPWRTWLSCEETDRGFVYECDVLGRGAAVRPAMGRFQHEAAAADPERQVIYLTEDEVDGCFYRFRPSTWGDLRSGVLEVMTAPNRAGQVAWRRVPDPSGAGTRTRRQVAEAGHFNGGEGCYYAMGSCYFTTKGDGRVWRYDAARQLLGVIYDDNVSGAPLRGVDNITGSRSRDLFVAEDGGNMEINVITPERVVAPFLRIVGQSRSEVTGPAFSPDGSRLYFSSQRGTSGASTGGITYEVRGPFRDRTRRPFTLAVRPFRLWG